jgi:hypothetical protein
MAQRRMFSKSITNSSSFLMMPQSAQNLYFHLGMNADDDGFCEHFTIMRMTESKPDDLKILAAKEFVKMFDDKILIILDWKENNYIRSDRYTPSKYLELYKLELKQISSGIPMVDEVATQVRLGKDSIGKDRKEKKEKNIIPPTLLMVCNFCNMRENNIDPEQFINFYNSKGWMIGKNKMKDWQSAVYTWEKNNKDKPQEESLDERLKRAGVNI